MIEKTINTRFGIATLNKNGYYEVEENGRKVNLHKLIYIANNGEIPEGYTIHHKNGVKTDNDPRNLVAMPKGYHKLVHDGYNDKSKRGVKMNNKKLCKTIEKLQEQINFAREELKELRANNERYSDAVAEKELSIAEKERIIHENEKLIAEKELLLVEKEKEILKLLKENKELIKGNKELKEKVENIKLALLEAEDEVENKEKEILRIHKELSGIREELGWAKYELSGTKGKLNNTLDELQQIKEENEELKMELEEDRGRMDALDLVLDDLQEEIDEITGEEEDLRVETEDLMNDINNIENNNFGFTEAGFRSLPEEIKANIRKQVTESFEGRLINIRIRFDKLKGRQGELQALYNGICRRRQRLQDKGVLN